MRGRVRWLIAHAIAHHKVSAWTQNTCDLPQAGCPFLVVRHVVEDIERRNQVEALILTGNPVATQRKLMELGVREPLPEAFNRNGGQIASLDCDA
jgi:hypothetical protein